MNRTSQTGQAPAYPAACAVAGAALALTLLSLHGLEAVKYARLAQPREPALALLGSALGPVDLGLAVLAGACGLAALLLEIRGRAVSAALSGAAAGPRAVLIGGVMLWLVHALLAPGLIVTGDGGTHVARVAHLAAALRGGDSVFWDNFFAGGGTLLQFTGPMFHWAAAVVALPGIAPEAAIKIVAVAARLAAAWFMYRLLRQLGLGRAACGLAALLYAGGFMVTYLVSVRSTFPQVLNIAAMPAILWFAERIRARGLDDRAALAGLPIAAGVMIGNHPPTVILFALWVACFLAMRIRQAGLARGAVPGFAAAAAATVLAGLFFLLPFALEKRFTAEDYPAAGLISVGLPGLVQFRNAVVWGAQGLWADYSTYLGYVLLAGAVLAIVPALGRAGRASAGGQAWRAAAPAAVLSLFVFAPYVRQGIFFFLFLAVMAAAGLDMLLARRGRHWAGLLLLAALLETGPLAVQPWLRTDLRPIRDAGFVLAGRAADARVMEVNIDAQGVPSIAVGPSASPIQVARVQEWRGPHKPDATKAANPVSAALKLAEAELRRTHALGAQTRDLLAALNIGWVVGIDGRVLGLPADWPGLIPDARIGAHWRIAAATPVLGSGRLSVVERPAYFSQPPFWDESFSLNDPAALAAMEQVAAASRRMGADPAHRRAAELLVVGPLPEGMAPAAGADPGVSLLAYQVEPGSVRMRLHAEGAGYVRLAHPASPFVRVTVNGRPVAPMADVFDLMVLPVAAGDSDIVLAGVPSGLRVASFWISMGMFAVLAAAAVGAVALRRGRP